jgi:hypothetical protein
MSGKPCQFSMRQMLGALTLFSISAAAFMWAVSQNDIRFIIGQAPTGAVIGAAIGAIIRRPIAAALIGAWLFIWATAMYVGVNRFHQSCSL